MEFHEDLQKLIAVGSVLHQAKVEAAKARDENQREKEYKDIQLAVKDVLAEAAPAVLERGFRHVIESEYSATTYLKLDDLLFTDGRSYGKGPCIRICKDDAFHDWKNAHDLEEFSQALLKIATDSDRHQRAAMREAEREAAQLARHPYRHIESELQRILWDIQNGRELNEAQTLVCAHIAFMSEHAYQALPSWDAVEEAEDGDD